jgi:hypothetical protein
MPNPATKISASVLVQIKKFLMTSMHSGKVGVVYLQYHLPLIITNLSHASAIWHGNTLRCVM